MNPQNTAHTPLPVGQKPVGQPVGQKPQTIAAEVAQGEINATADFIADLNARLVDVNDEIEAHEGALRSLSTRRTMMIAALSQLEDGAAGTSMGARL